MSTYREYKYSYLIDTKSKIVMIEDSSRKKVRRIARKKYREEYMHNSTYIIVSGDSIKEAIQMYEASIAMHTKKQALTVQTIDIDSKNHSKSKSTDTKQAATKQASKKTTSKQKKQVSVQSAFDELIAQEDTKISRINKRKQIATAPVMR